VQERENAIEGKKLINFVSNVHYPKHRSSNIHSSIPAIFVIVPITFLNDTLKECMTFPVLMVTSDLMFVKSRVGQLFIL
jgi:hypothetical protein